MKFDSKKDFLFSFIILGVNIFLIGITILGITKGELEPNEYWTIILIVGVVVLLFWIHFGTNYEISKEDGLIYRSGPINGKISINRITEISIGKTLWIGYRLATSRKGLIIKYDKYNEIYISPKSNKLFVEKILELKKDIKIT